MESIVLCLETIFATSLPLGATCILYIVFTVVLCTKFDLNPLRALRWTSVNCIFVMIAINNQPITHTANTSNA